MDTARTRFLYHFILLFLYLRQSSAEESRGREIGFNLDQLGKEWKNVEDNPEEEDATESYRRPRFYPRGYNGRRGDMQNYPDDHDHDPHDHDHEEEPRDDDQGDMKAIGKVDYWGGYYDFLINEGSYKFWAVFQLATAALLIYSGFAALYYAKVNPAITDDEFDDWFRRRRRRRTTLSSPEDKPFNGLDSLTFQRILDAVEREVH